MEASTAELCREIERRLERQNLAGGAREFAGGRDRERREDEVLRVESKELGVPEILHGRVGGQGARGAGCESCQRPRQGEPPPASRAETSPSTDCPPVDTSHPSLLPHSIQLLDETARPDAHESPVLGGVVRAEVAPLRFFSDTER